MAILVVSAVHDTRCILSLFLRHAGYDVRELAVPDQAVEAARECRLVITDYPTATSAGSTVTQMLRRDPRTRRVRILNATTWVTPEMLSAAKEAGVDASVALPASFETLLGHVQALVGASRSAAGR